MGFFRKLLRRSFYTSAALSMLLLFAMLILWPVSYYRGISVSFVGNTNGYSLGMEDGRIHTLLFTKGARSSSERNCFIFDNWEVTPKKWSHWSYLTWNTRDTSGDFFLMFHESPSTTLGVAWFHPPGSSNISNVSIPVSYVALLFFVFPLLAFRRIRQRRKLAGIERCSSCGYDLRAHSPGDRCPECGTVKKS